MAQHGGETRATERSGAGTSCLRQTTKKNPPRRADFSHSAPAESEFSPPPRLAALRGGRLFEKSKLLP